MTDRQSPLDYGRQGFVSFPLKRESIGCKVVRACSRESGRA
jgi:hypothetical protein